MIDENELIEYLRELKTYSKELMNHCELGSEAYFEGEVSAFNTAIELCKEMGKKKAGKWIIEREPNGKVLCFHCSACDYDFSYIGIQTAYQYCPRCGSKMDDSRAFERDEVK